MKIGEARDLSEQAEIIEAALAELQALSLAHQTTASALRRLATSICQDRSEDAAEERQRLADLAAQGLDIDLRTASLLQGLVERLGSDAAET